MRGGKATEEESGTEISYTAEKRRYKQGRAIRRIEAGGEDLMDKQARMAQEQRRMRDLLERMQQPAPVRTQLPVIIQQQPHQGVINYPVPSDPSLFARRVVSTGAKDEVLKIYIKNIAKAIANEKKVRFKKTGDSKKALKKQYTNLKSATRKRIKSGKNAHYASENVKIKKLPAKQRKGARAKLKAELSKREKTLMKSLPPAAKMKIADLRRLIAKARLLKW